MDTSVRRALYGRLSSDITLSGSAFVSGLLGTASPGYARAIYYQTAPADSGYPLIIFNDQSHVPTEAFTEPGAYEDMIWLIKAIDRNSSADRAESIAARVKFLLNDATLSISGRTLLYLRRQSDIAFQEYTEGESYRHAGALYRLVYE